MAFTKSSQILLQAHEGKFFIIFLDATNPTYWVIIQNEVTDATQEILVELHLVMFISFALQQKDGFKCNSTGISGVASVTTFYIMNKYEF